MNMNRKTETRLLSQFGENWFVLLPTELSEVASKVRFLLDIQWQRHPIDEACILNERISFLFLGFIFSSQVAQECQTSLPSAARSSMGLFQV
jgi:hypothetical protein